MKFGEERPDLLEIHVGHSAVSALKVAPFRILVAPRMEFDEGVEGGRPVGILLGEPYFVPFEKFVFQHGTEKSGVM